MAAGYHEIVLTPGRRSERMAVGKGIPQDAVVQTGNFIGFMLKSCASRGLDRVLLFGGLGKLSKLSMGYFYTHSGTSPRGTEAMARLAIDAGAEGDVVKSVRNANTTDEAIEILIENGLEVALNNLAEAITFRAREYVDGGMEIGTAIVSLNGDVVGRSNLDGSLWGRYMS
jgi:cobalt-precorrin-5B (C1)-methyltransferase